MLGRPLGSGGGFRLTIRASDDLQPILELRTEHELGQLVMAVEPSPAFLRGVDEFEHHRQRRRVREAALRADRAVRTVANVLSIGLDVLKCFQCSAGKS